MEWVRGEEIGRGCFGIVNIATTVKWGGGYLPPVMAVKSCLLADAATLLKEKMVLDRLKGCPEVVGCYGDDVTADPDGHQRYNVFLEYVPGGTLSDLIRRRGPMCEEDVRRCAGSILRGLRHVHDAGLVHCDLKPQNVLVAGRGRTKIIDFGLAKPAGRTPRPLGTPLYMAPESVRAEQEPASDIWSLGCVVAEMTTGRPLWHCDGLETAALLFRIVLGRNEPEIPGAMSAQGKDFLSRCLARDPRKRWTAEMLLQHPFVAAAVDGEDGIDEQRRHFSACASSPLIRTSTPSNPALH